jgi:hypothetical protein
MRSPSARSRFLLADFATVWGELFPAEQARIVQLLVERVEVQVDALEVRIRAEGLVRSSPKISLHGLARQLSFSPQDAQDVRVRHGSKS